VYRHKFREFAQLERVMYCFCEGVGPPGTKTLGDNGRDLLPRAVGCVDKTFIQPFVENGDERIVGEGWMIHADLGRDAGPLANKGGPALLLVRPPAA